MASKMKRRRMMKRCAVVLLLLTCCAAAAGCSPYKKWRDEEGVVHYGFGVTTREILLDPVSEEDVEEQERETQIFIRSFFEIYENKREQHAGIGFGVETVYCLAAENEDLDQHMDSDQSEYIRNEKQIYGTLSDICSFLSGRIGAIDLETKGELLNAIGFRLDGCGALLSFSPKEDREAELLCRISGLEGVYQILWTAPDGTETVLADGDTSLSEDILFPAGSNEIGIRGEHASMDRIKISIRGLKEEDLQ